MRIKKVIDFPEWLSNPMVVDKLGSAWQVRIGFKDLNKAIPKKPYPLLRINQLLDSVAGHELFSFLDTYKRYHQIPMAKKDMDKITFVTDDTYICYTRMPFWLKKCWS